MIKRVLMTLGLSAALLGGGISAVHASSRVAAHPAAIVAADVIAGDTGAQTADTDPNAPCAVDAATGSETGDCQNSQNTAGPEDSGNAAAADGDSLQQGDQSGTTTPGTTELVTSTEGQ